MPISDLVQMLRRDARLISSSRRLLRCRNAALASSLSAILITTLLILCRSTAKPSSHFDQSKLNWSRSKATVKLQPSLGSMNGTDLIWQIPHSPKAVLFVAHGCNGKAANFWDKSSSCPNCVGLPEERLLVLHALERNMAVLAISSVGKCWTYGKEKENIKWIIKWWTVKYRLENLPLLALGASSGGYFVSALATEMRFCSIVLIIAEGVFNAIDASKDYPPTLFVHMPKDRRRMESIKLNMESLRMKGIPIKEVRSMEFSLTPKFLSHRIPGLDQALSIRLFEVFRERGFIDEQGYMKRDGRETNWKQALKEKNLLSHISQLQDHIQEELNLAYGYHEMTSLQYSDIFGWFKSNMSFQ
ncbi:hypothetical protein AXF42_Ash000419 [Apostasia shenzhenica]|uniref:Uncharacterized protein n=1 Tax=Apostasia shenzhenica TaxID=1088818 RepID=A0A2I0AGA2_9ASPA|nr:hypothetical protein AXF42_Ash000419 [Apostasia shenzhenica]